MTQFRALVERARSNLFFVPVALVAAAIVLSIVTISIDARIRGSEVSMPDLLVSTVSSARALLGVIASATIAFAGVSISISLLLIQLASSQFSPRVLHSFFRDPVTKWVTGLVIGTFTYCLLILRVVRSPGESSAPEVIPHVSVLVATFLGVASIVAVVALINHSARSMQVGQIIRRITDEGRAQIDAFADRPQAAVADPTRTQPPSSEPEGFVIEADDEGWVQLLDVDRLLDALPEGITARLEIFVGGFVPLGAPLCSLTPAVQKAELDTVVRGVRRAVVLGKTRTTQQDLAFVFRQLVDIALRALSPGINDPTTAQEVLVHLGTLLRGLLRRGIQTGDVTGEAGRRVMRPHDPGPDDYVNLAFDQLRGAGAATPAIASTMLEVIGGVISDLEQARITAGIDALRRQAGLVLEAVEGGDALPADVEAVRALASRDLP